MQIVITDGYAVNPGDLSWKRIATLGDLIYYDRTNAEQVVDRCKDADILIVNKTPLNASVIHSCQKLRMIAVAATGYNVIDVAAAAKKNIPVCNVPVYGTDSVAQHTIALLLELTNRVGLHANSVQKGEWVTNADWCYAKTPIIELSNKVLGIVGYGRIGKQTANIARALGMKVIFSSNHMHTGEEALWQRTLPEIFAKSDFISLHCPLTPVNNGFINAELLLIMKSSAFLINTSRGQLINENDLAVALEKGHLGGAALDVLSVEPPPANHPLLQVKNCLITPHNAWISFEARQRILETIFENIREFLSGKPQNVVNAVK